MDIKNESMKDSFLNFVKTLDYIEIKQDNTIEKISHNKKNKFSEFAGMWQDNPIDINSIRDKAWSR